MSHLGRSAYVAASLASAILLLGACGSETGSGAGGDAGQEPGGADPSTPALTGSPDGYVPGDPTNEVRPASDAELAGWPACDEVWTSGPDAEIPGDYEGCLIGDDAVVADRIGCSFGGSMTTFDDRYYGVLGAVVNDAGESLVTSQDYARAYRQCAG